jgi:hypothetical protein
LKPLHAFNESADTIVLKRVMLMFTPSYCQGGQIQYTRGGISNSFQGSERLDVEQHASSSEDDDGRMPRVSVQYGRTAPIQHALFNYATDIVRFFAPIDSIITIEKHWKEPSIPLPTLLVVLSQRGLDSASQMKKRKM